MAPGGFTGAAHHACAVTPNEGDVTCYAWRIDTSPAFATSAAAASSFAAWPANAWYAAVQLSRVDNETYVVHRTSIRQMISAYHLSIDVAYWKHRILQRTL